MLERRLTYFLIYHIGFKFFKGGWGLLNTHAASLGDLRDEETNEITTTTQERD